jgi:hypothetical protein
MRNTSLLLQWPPDNGRHILVPKSLVLRRLPVAGVALWHRSKEKRRVRGRGAQTARRWLYAEFLVIARFPRRHPILADVTKASFAETRRATMT